MLYAASIYMTLGRLVRSVNGERHAIVSPRWLTAIFVTGDVLALAIQGTAAGLMVVAEYAQAAQGIAIAGLIIQIVIFGVFWLTSWLFHTRMRRDSASWCAVPPELPQWEQTMLMLYAVSALIMLRSIFRVIEFVMGAEGYLLGHEWPLYIFDTLPMLAVMGIFWQWFPSSVNDKGHRVTSVSLQGLNVHPGERLDESLYK